MTSKPIKFEEYKQQILDSLNSRGASLGLNEPVTLVDGFFNFPLQKEMTGDLVIGGPTLPAVLLVGQNSGRLYFFALKVLLPDVEL